MKKSLAVLMTTVFLLSGCGRSDLQDYQSAVLMTDAYTNGRSETSLSVDLIFNEQGLSFEEQRDLSYFEGIDMTTTMTYIAGELFRGQMDTYFNFGGLGFDMVYYMNGDEVLIKLPIMDKYMAVSGGMDTSDTSVTMDEEDAIKRLIDSWNGVLNEEDVFSGSKAYVMTDKGQLKTTTYTISINDDQFDVLKATLLTLLEEEEILESFLEGSGNYTSYEVDGDAVQSMVQDLLKEVTLTSFEGKAYVDFDGRLVRQDFTADLVNHSAQPGQVASLHIEYETFYDLLGQVEDLYFPEVKDEDLLKLEDGDSIQDYFPSGLF